MIVLPSYTGLTEYKEKARQQIYVYNLKILEKFMRMARKANIQNSKNKIYGVEMGT